MSVPQKCVLYKSAVAKLNFGSTPSGHMVFLQHRINVDATSWRCIDVDVTLSQLYVHAGNRHQLNETSRLGFIESGHVQLCNVQKTLMLFFSV